MLVREMHGAQGADDLEEGERYYVRYAKPGVAPGSLEEVGSFYGTFINISLGAGNQLFAHFKGKDSVDVRFILFPIYRA